MVVKFSKWNLFSYIIFLLFPIFPYISVGLSKKITFVHIFVFFSVLYLIYNHRIPKKICLLSIVWIIFCLYLYIRSIIYNVLNDSSFNFSNYIYLFNHFKLVIVMIIYYKILTYLRKGNIDLEKIFNNSMKLLLIYATSASISQLLFSKDFIFNSYISSMYSGNFIEEYNKSMFDIVCGYRITSIFVQPSSTGLFALFSSFYFLKRYILNSGSIFYLLLSIIIGLIALTKVYMGGMFLLCFFIFFYVFIDNKKFFKLNFKFILYVFMVVFIIVKILIYFDKSYSLQVLTQYINFDNIYNVFFSSRFGSDSYRFNTNTEAFLHNPLFGSGIASGIVLGDSEYMPIIGAGGIIGITLFFSFFIALSVILTKNKLYLETMFLIVLFAVGIGFPWVEQSRTTPLIIIYFILMLTRTKHVMGNKLE